MHAADWFLTLQWTALFAAQALAAFGTGLQLAGGATIAAGWLVTTRTRTAAPTPSPRIGVRLPGWGIRLVAGGLAAALLVAYLSAPVTGDATLASQLRAAIVDSALALLGGAGLSGAASLVWVQRVTRPA